jgi:hypothetical protein
VGEIVPSADSAFKQFKTIVWGYRAMFVLLHTYRVKHGLNTLKGMIERYAPPMENDTGGYLKTVCNRSGIPPERNLNTLDGTAMIPVVCAMSRVENGVQAIREDVEAGWELFIQSTGA